MIGGDRRSRACGGRGGIKDRVLDILRARPLEAFTAESMGKALNVSFTNTAQALGKLARDGLALRIQPGSYRAGGAQ